MVMRNRNEPQTEVATSHRVEFLIDSDDVAALDAVADTVGRPRSEVLRELLRTGLPRFHGGNQATLTVTLDIDALTPLLHRSRLSLRQFAQVALDFALCYPEVAGVLPPSFTASSRISPARL